MAGSRLSLGVMPVVPADIDVQPDDLLRAIARLIAKWPGKRNPETPFLCAANVNGTRPPLFWVLQSGAEFARLSESLPPDQPVYCLKSVFMGEIGFRREDSLAFMVPPYIDAASDAFVKDILHAADGRPFVLGGNCTGSVSALDLALRPDIRPETLILMNYPLPPRPYDGDLELLFGQQEWDEFCQDPARPACFPQAQVTRLEGEHGTYFAGDEILKIVDAVRRSVARLEARSQATPQAAPAFPVKTV